MTPAQRIILARAARLGIVQTEPTERAAAIALVMRGWVDLTVDGLVLTAAGTVEAKGFVR